MPIVDTDPIVALLNRNDADHESCAELLESHDAELLIMLYVLTEACYLLAEYVSPDAEINLIEPVAAKDLIQVPAEKIDLSRMAELTQQYRWFPSASPRRSWPRLPSASGAEATTLATAVPPPEGHGAGRQGRFEGDGAQGAWSWVVTPGARWRVGALDDFGAGLKGVGLPHAAGLTRCWATWPLR